MFLIHDMRESDSYAERFIRTLKTKLYRYLTAADTLKFTNVLPQLLSQYNRSYHRSIGTAPSKVSEKNLPQVWESLYGSLKTDKTPVFKVGDKVRLNKKFRPFKKSYLPGWTEEVFEIRKVVPGKVTTYKVRELDETPLIGSFY